MPSFNSILRAFASLGHDLGFNQIIDFLNGSSIKYALTVNPNIYVSCIKQFWTSVTVKKVNDVKRLQALVDKKKVIIMEATLRDALRLDDAEGRKFNFSKYIFNSLVRNVDSSTKFCMYSRFLQLMSKAQVGDLSLHTTKYTSPALTQKVFANIRMVGKGFFGVETPLFKGMIVEQQVANEGDVEVNVDDVPAVGVVVEGVVSTADDEIPIAVEEPSISFPTPPTPPPQPSQDQPSTSQDKIAQALEITKLKSRVKKLERRNKASKLKWLKKRIIADMDADVDVSLEDAKEVVVEKSADVDESADVQERKAESQAQIYQIDLEHADKVLSMQDDEESKPAELQEVVEVVTTAKLITEVVTAASATITAAALQLITVAAPTLTVVPSAARRRKGVVIRDPQKSTTPSTIIHFEAKSKDKGKGILVEEPNPLKKKQNEDNAVKRYQALKRKPQTEAQARKNMMIYLRNVTKEQMDEEDSRALKRLNESQEDKAAKKQKLDEEVKELKRHLQIVPNDEHDPDIQAQIWKNQRSVHGQAKVKSWKLLESYGVQIITFTTTQLILLVERRYPLTRFTLDQMLNNVQLEVEEESEVSLELLSFRVDVAMDFKENMLSV
nr:hypothetical protein [Tanacetum cinerariifolium]